MPAKPIAFAAGLAAAAVSLAACSPVHAGAAATVGHTRISVSQVRAAADAQLAAAASSGTAADPAAAEQSSLSGIIQDDLVADAARAKGVTVSESDVQTFLAQQRKANGTDENTATANGIPFAHLHQAVYVALLVNGLEQAVANGQTDPTAQQTALSNYLVAFAKQEGVTVSPRYGVWDPAHLGVTDGNTFSSPLPSSPVAPLVGSPVAPAASPGAIQSPAG